MAGQVIVLLGPTGAGKSQQAKCLEEDGWASLSSGELLRHNSKLEPATHGGHLVASNKVEQLINSAISRVETNTNIVLDGFPREIGEANWLESKLAELNRPLTHVFLINISSSLAATRLAGRGRNDDTPEAQAAKWHDYTRLTVAVVERYRRLGLLVEINGADSVEKIAAQIKRFTAL